VRPDLSRLAFALGVEHILRVAQPGQSGIGFDQYERKRALAPPFARVSLRPIQPLRELHRPHFIDPHGKNPLAWDD
jgi:hypothetical protein